MNILLWVVFGALVGFIADYFDKSVHLSWIERILVGVVGAVVGGTLANLLTGEVSIGAAEGFDVLSIIISVVGALVTLFVWKRLRPA